MKRTVPGFLYPICFLLLAPLALAAEAIGAHGIMVEIHPDPDSALSDGPQSLTLGQFGDLMGALGLGRTS